MTREEIIAKIRKVESLFEGTGFEGERSAAAGALKRLQAQLREAPEPAEEFQFSLADPWKHRLFLALVRRHGLYPYRLPRQRRQTVMLRLPRRLLDEVIWPQFLELSALLDGYLEEATNDIIARGVHQDFSDAGAEPPGLPDA